MTSKTLLVIRVLGAVRYRGIDYNQDALLCFANGSYSSQTQSGIALPIERIKAYTPAPCTILYYTIHTFATYKHIYTSSSPTAASSAASCTTFSLAKANSHNAGLNGHSSQAFTNPSNISSVNILTTT